MKPLPCKDILILCDAPFFPLIYDSILFFHNKVLVMTQYIEITNGFFSICSLRNTGLDRSGGADIYHQSPGSSTGESSNDKETEGATTMRLRFSSSHFFFLIGRTASKNIQPSFGVVVLLGEK